MPKPEPTETVTCRSCGCRFELLVYLADSLRLRKAPFPCCETCTERDRAKRSA